MATTIVETVTLTTTTCWKCGVTHAIPAHMLNTARASGGEIFCPSGHSGVFRESESDILRRQLAEEQRRLVSERAAHDQSKARIREAEGNVRKARIVAECAKTKARKLRQRAAAGKCPCCQEKFPDVAAHMAAKHPGYGEKKVPQPKASV